MGMSFVFFFSITLKSLEFLSINTRNGIYLELMEHNDEIQFDDLICMDELMNININTNKFPHFFVFSASEKNEFTGILRG